MFRCVKEIWIAGTAGAAFSLEFILRAFLFLYSPIHPNPDRSSHPAHHIQHSLHLALKRETWSVKLDTRAQNVMYIRLNGLN